MNPPSHTARSEAELREALSDPARRKDALVELAELCRRTGRAAEGQELARTFVAEAKTAEDTAFGLLGCGQMSESKEGV